MSKNLKYFLIIFLAGIFAGGNIIEKKLTDFFYTLELANNSRFLTAQASSLLLDKQISGLKPFRNKNIADLEMGAKSAVSVFIDNDGKEKILFEKEKNTKLPIASLTKLMTAKIILENYDLTKIIKISSLAAKLPGNGADKLKPGQSFRVIDLLYPAMMESNNTAVQSLAEVIGEEKFVELMNVGAKSLGMQNTQFLNPTGLDQNGQYSTVEDLVKLVGDLLKNHSFIWQILSLEENKLYSAKGELIYTVASTNELLGEIPSIIGGKTGDTPLAGGCLLLVTEALDDSGYLINIVLNSKDRFEEIKKLIDWNKDAYVW